ncbi:MAG: hypothetical protein KGI81_04570 [Betaproteobacteria bacterium]|nr:hypothetical protein [Betaproteobacteria bacterium]
MSQKILPTIEAFPNDNKIWRLDWLGDISFRRHIRFRTPLIRVSLSPWQDDFPYQKQTQIQVELPIGTLPVLGIGTLWHQGRNISDPPYDEAIFNVLSKKGQTRLIKSGIATEKGEFVIPFDSHHFHSLHTHSWCLAIKTEERATLIIPCQEIIRFYFGSSSGLLTRLARGPFDPTKFWQSTNIDHQSGHVHIDLAQGISGRSASDIARIAFDPHALRCAKLIPASLIASPENKRYPQAHLPFSGTSTLKVKGMRIGRPADNRFLVFQILSCSYPFPFSSLTYTMTNREYGNSDGYSTPNTSVSSGEGKVFAAPLSKTITVHNDPPDSNRKPKEAKIHSNVRFPDLFIKHVSRTEPEPKIVTLMDGTFAEQDGYLPEEEGRNGNAAIDLVTADAVPALAKGYPPENPEFGEAILLFAREEKEKGYVVSFSPLNARQRFPQISRMPKVIIEGGEIHPLCLVQTENGFRPRYVSIIVLSSDKKKSIYLLLESELPYDKGKKPISILEVTIESVVNAEVIARIIKNTRI